MVTVIVLEVFVVAVPLVPQEAQRKAIDAQTSRKPKSAPTFLA
jgi:hypothetical protein